MINRKNISILFAIVAMMTLFKTVNADQTLDQLEAKYSQLAKEYNQSLVESQHCVEKASACYQVCGDNNSCSSRCKTTLDSCRRADTALRKENYRERERIIKEIQAKAQLTAINDKWRCDCNQNLGSCMASIEKKGSKVHIKTSSNKCSLVAWDANGAPKTTTVLNGRNVEDVWFQSEPVLSIRSCQVCKDNSM